MSSVYCEPSREIPIAAACDVLVCGGGPAGVAAALSAARSGAKTSLLEVHGCLGGVWTAGLLTYVLDPKDKTGLLPELVRRLEALAGRPIRRDLSNPHLPWCVDAFYFDPELMKLALEQLCLEAGVTVQLHTRVASAWLDSPDGGLPRLMGAVTESKSGRQAWQAKVCVDATGDGDLAAFAGCGFDLGRPGSGAVQPMSLGVLLGGVDSEAICPYLHGAPDSGNEPVQRLLTEIRRAGFEPSYTNPVLVEVQSGLYGLMCGHLYNVSALDAAQTTRATLQARAESHAIVGALRSLGGMWSGLQIVATAEQIGVREARRIHGRYTITDQDLITGAHHPDAVCRVNFPVDVHPTEANQGEAYSSEGVRSQPYDVPLCALIAKDVDNLVLAGRCISGDFYAHASYRVTGDAVPIGEAAGRLAAEAARLGQMPSYNH